MKILEVEKLSKHFGGIQAVWDVSFKVESGEISAVIGPNGAGKSTLFNLITGHLDCDAGSVIFREREITGLPPHKICRLGLGRSFQRTTVFDRFSVFQNVQSSVIAGKGKTISFFVPVKKQFSEIVFSQLEDVELADKADMLAAELSYGERRRLELAITLVNRPECLLLDEPTAGMSITETEYITMLLKKLAKSYSVSLMLVEHDLNVVFNIAEKIRVMYQGRLLREGTPDEIREDEEVKRIYIGN